MLESEPEMYPDGPKKACENWKKLEPMRIDEIIARSGIEIDLESEVLEYRKIADGKNYGYQIGFHKKGTTIAHGIARVVYHNGQI